jgi:signal transduction histidine kinase/ligand-binding sensor domain-containing protein
VPHPTRIFHFFIVGICLALTCLRGEYKAPSEYTLREWHISDGLPADEVLGLAQDMKGYLWVATNRGIARFDGMAFDVIATPSEASARGIIYRPSLIVGERTARLDRGSLVTYSDEPATGNSDGFYHCENGSFNFTQEPVISDKVVKAVFAEDDGTLWLGCEDGTLLRRHGLESEVYKTPIGLGGKYSPAFAMDAAKQLWVVIGTHLARHDGAHWTRIDVPLERGETQIRIASSRTSGPWLITRTTVFKWSGDKLDEIAKLPDLLGAHFIQTAIEDRHGDLWIGTRSQGLFRISEKQILHIPTSNEDISILLEDTGGSIWVGTNGGGLNRLRPRAHRLCEKTSGLKDNYSHTVSEDESGAIWLGNRDGGAARIVNGEVDPISKRAAWRPFNAMSVYPAAGGGMWISTGIGVFKTDAAQPENVQRVHSLNNFKLVRSTFVARNGDYWLSLNPDRIARSRGDQTTVFGPSEGFDGREVRAFAEDASGAIWVGAASGKLFRSKGDKFERILIEGEKNLGSLQALRFEPDGTLLIGTTRTGVLILPQGDRSHPRTLDSEHGLPNNNVTQILADDFGHYWFASYRGISRTSRSQLREFIEGKTEHVHAILLGKDDGVPDLSCLGLFQPAAWKAHDGKLWFTTRKGTLCIDPALISDEDEAAAVTIAGVKYDGEAQSIADEMKVRSTVRKIEIRFSALNLATPERVLVKYRLDGFDNDWVLQHTARVVAYPRLPAGNYVFRVMASNGNGEWNNEGAQLRITVIPTWWQSPWAQLAYLLTLIFVVAALARIWSHRRLRMRLERLEREKAIERERTRIAQNIHDDLGASLTRISLLTQSAQNENPAQASKFEEIYATAHAITRSMDEIVWAVNPKCDDMENLVYYVGNFAQGFLAAASVRCRLDLPKVLPSIPLTSQVRHNLFLCCKEALNNVVKHSHATEVIITISVNDATLKISITDNGRGLAAARKSANSSPSFLRTSGGNGLKNMRLRMVEMGGKCVFSTQATDGTIVTFTIGLPSHIT